MTDSSWDFRDPASKDRLLAVLGREMSDTFELAADPGRWQAPTACAGWEVRDVIGHLVDTTEGYLPAFAAARSGESRPEPVGLQAMAERNLFFPI
jgi:hypothetical protein